MNGKLPDVEGLDVMETCLSLSGQLTFYGCSNP